VILSKTAEYNRSQTPISMPSSSQRQVKRPLYLDDIGGFVQVGFGYSKPVFGKSAVNMLPQAKGDGPQAASSGLIAASEAYTRARPFSDIWQAMRRD